MESTGNLIDLGKRQEHDKMWKRESTAYMFWMHHMQCISVEWGKKRETWGSTREWDKERKQNMVLTQTLPSLRGNLTQKCGNPLLEFMLWKQGRGGRRGITAFSLSLRDHNDDKESITVLHWRYVHSWGDSQSAGCSGLPLHSLPLLGTIWGVALCQLLEDNSIDFSSMRKKASDRGTVYVTTVHGIRFLSPVPQH